MKVQPFLAVIASLYVLGGLYSAFRGDMKMAIINFAYGVAGAVFATMASK